jgi:hypothetical protein
MSLQFREVPAHCAIIVVVVRLSFVIHSGAPPGGQLPATTGSTGSTGSTGNTGNTGSTIAQSTTQEADTAAKHSTSQIAPPRGCTEGER